MHVWSDALVNLTVFDANGAPHSRTSVDLLPEPAPERVDLGWFCTWMPFQKGQAARQDAIAAPSAPSARTHRQDLELSVAHSLATSVGEQRCNGARIGAEVRQAIDALVGAVPTAAPEVVGIPVRDDHREEKAVVAVACPKLPALEDAIVTLRHAMQDDLEYAWAWHCNIAVPLRDALGQGTISHEQSNLAAAHLLRHLFDVDITIVPHYAATQALDAERGQHPTSDEGGAHEAVDAVFAARGDRQLLDFGAALRALKHGERVARLGWNGKGMFVYMVPAASYPAQTGAAKAHFGEGSMVPYNAYFALKGVDGAISTWVPSINDSLAEDWVVVA